MNSRRAFTLVELLAAIAVFSLLLVVLFSITENVGTAWVRGEGQMEKRRNSRVLLNLITSDLKSALVPRAHDFNSGSSNLQFVLNPPIGLPEDILNPSALFWQAPVGSGTRFGELAEVGYFVKYNASPANGATRFQLCRFFVPSSVNDPAAPLDPERATRNPDFLIYDRANRFAWLREDILRKYTDATAPAYRGLFAENIIGFWVRCLDPEGQPITQTASYTKTDGSRVDSSAYPANTYDSAQGYRYRNASGQVVDVPPPALPHSVQVSIVLLDSRAAANLTAAEADTIRQGYSAVRDAATLSAFVANLPLSVRSSAWEFSARIHLANAQ